MAVCGVYGAGCRCSYCRYLLVGAHAGTTERPLHSCTPLSTPPEGWRSSKNHRGGPTGLFRFGQQLQLRRTKRIWLGWLFFAGANTRGEVAAWFVHHSSPAPILTARQTRRVPRNLTRSCRSEYTPHGERAILRKGVVPFRGRPCFFFSSSPD